MRKRNRRRRISVVILTISLVLLTGCEELEGILENNGNQSRDVTIYSEEKKENSKSDDMESSSVDGSSERGQLEAPNKLDLVDGYNALESFFLSLDGAETLSAIKDKAAGYGLKLYEAPVKNETSGKIVSTLVYVASKPAVEEKAYSYLYEFDVDSVKLHFDGDPQKLWVAEFFFYNSVINAEYFPEGRHGKERFYVDEGGYVSDPTRVYNSLKEILDEAKRIK